jgi:hypothetical protein
MRLWVKESERKPEPAPIEPNSVIAVILGTASWAIALALILFLNQTLAQPLPQWWALTCVFGIALGIFGYFKVRKR